MLIIVWLAANVWYFGRFAAETDLIKQTHEKHSYSRLNVLEMEIRQKWFIFPQELQIMRQWTFIELPSIPCNNYHDQIQKLNYFSYYTFMSNTWFWLAERHLIKINIVCWIMKPRDGTWQWVILLDDGWYAKKYRPRRIYARKVYNRFRLTSNEASPRSTLVFSGWQFRMLPSRAVNTYIIIPCLLWIAKVLFSP